MISEIEKLQLEKKEIQNEINALQSELNKARLLILTKKGDQGFVQIQKLKNNIEDLTKQIQAMSGFQTRLDTLKQTQSSSESHLQRLNSKILKTQSEIFNYEKMTHDQNLQISKINDRKEKFIQGIESISEETQDDYSSISSNIESQKNQLNELTRQLASISSIGSDPYFILSKSDQRVSNLSEKYSQLSEYYNAELVEQMTETIPVMEREDEDLAVKIEEAVKERKEFVQQSEEIKHEITRLEYLYSEKKIDIKEKQSILRTLEEEVKFYAIETERLNKLRDRVEGKVQVQDSSEERVEKLRNEIFEIQKLLKTKENNYNNGIRSVASRISKISAHISDLKKEIRAVLEKISKVKRT